MYLYDERGDRLGDDLEQLGGVLAALHPEAGDQQTGQPGHYARHHLQGKQNQNRQPVEAVVDGRPGECPVMKR